jgi:putative endonuclease
MTKHNKIGTYGEALASTWCTQQGFLILETNWRYKRLEADIIASKADVLHVIEVKTRTSTMYGLPEESISVKKIAHMLTLGNAYKALHPKFNRVQFDVLAILLIKNQAPEYFYIPDVYV